MGSFVAQLPALIGVLVGTLGTIVATTVVDWTKWRRSQSTRWDERRIDAYVELAQVVKEIHAIAVRMLASERPDSRGHHIEREVGLAKLAEADVRHTLAWENVLLLGDAPTVRAGRAWRDAVWNVERVARGSAEADADLPSLLNLANEKRDAFYRAARRSLGVRGGTVDQSTWLVKRLSGTYTSSAGRPATPPNRAERDG